MHIIGGCFRRRPLESPKGAQTRPTASRLRESLFNICQTYIEGSRFLDLFAGSGAIGLEAISRGAASASFCENHPEALRCLQKNIALLGVQKQTQLLRGSVLQSLEWMARQKMQFDIVFADPPYHKEGEARSISEEIICWMDTHDLLAVGGQLFIEEDSRYTPQIEAFQTLQLQDSRRMGNTVLQRYEKNGNLSPIRGMGT